MIPVLQQVPGIAMEPIPHVRLPAPFDEYCLTPMLQTDAEYLPRIVNDPSSKMFGYRDNGGNMTPEYADKWVAQWRNEAELSRS